MTTDWQPIETAPKDGRTVFVFGTLEGSPHARPRVEAKTIEEAFWNDQGQCWVHGYHDAFVIDPTHWTPFPEPPND